MCTFIKLNKLCLVAEMQTVEYFGRFPSFCEDSELDGFLSFKHRLLFPKLMV